MSIVSFRFIAFVVILIPLYFVLPKKYQRAVLLCASMLFYLTGGIKGCIYITITICSQYMIALILEKRNVRMTAELAETETDPDKKKEIKKRFSASKKRLIFLSVFINLGLLFFLKYIDGTIGKINSLLGTNIKPFGLLVPLGLSYYTFKSIGYVVDVARGRIHAQRNILKLTLFISYFPALVQGPIDRYENLADQLYAEHKFDYERFCFGLQRMLWGYMKKLILAERAAVIIQTIQSGVGYDGYEGLLIAIMMILATIHLYADFSGGMDIVIGLSEIFGVTLTENFRRPFMSHSVAEYWRRWHITLGAWMGTYVFTPLSLSQPFKKLGKICRKKLGNQYGRVIAPSIASFITFFFVGMWHGVNRGYVLFSIYNAALVSTATLLSDFYELARKKLKIREDSGVFHGFQMARTFTLVTIGSLIIKPNTIGMIKAAFHKWNPWIFFDGTLYTLGLNRQNFTLLVVSIFVLIAVDILQERGVSIRKKIAEQNIILRWAVYLSAICTLVIFGMYGPGYNAADFVYQRF